MVYSFSLGGWGAGFKQHVKVPASREYLQQREDQPSVHRVIASFIQSNDFPRNRRSRSLDMVCARFRKDLTLTLQLFRPSAHNRSTTSLTLGKRRRKRSWRKRGRASCQRQPRPMAPFKQRGEWSRRAVCSIPRNLT